MSDELSDALIVLLDRALEELGVTPLPDATDLRRAYVGAMSRQLLAERFAGHASRP